MVTSIAIHSRGEKCAVQPKWEHGRKLVLANGPISGAVDIEIRFSEKIEAFRNHDYTWKKAVNGCISSAFAPKILKLSTGIFVQPSHQIGIWEIIDGALWWRFNVPNSNAVTSYTAPHNGKSLEAANSVYEPESTLCLLFPEKAVEFSRSEIPFSAIACFTDHCDFDTRQNLILQRELFKRCGVKVTKGFFLNHFSKRADNASWQNDEDELRKWIADGHELCYHSLSQSLKNDEESIADFRNFEPPVSLPVWIDHGYQPYNFSLFKRYVGTESDYSAILENKRIAVLWNYIDSGTAATGVINQLNPGQFTLGKFLSAYKGHKLTEKAGRMLKNIMFHYYGQEELLSAYGQISKNFRKVVFHRQFKNIGALIRNAISVGAPLSTVAFGWKSNRKKPYPLAKYSPILFRHRMGEKDFWVFQTLDMVDFKQALCAGNLDLLTKEKGLFIAHTYFSVPMEYHTGRVFETPDRISAQVEANFADLGRRIAKGEIWNPTLSELVGILSRFEKIAIDVDADGNISKIESHNLHHRFLS